MILPPILKNIFVKNENFTYYLALEIQNGVVKAAIWKDSLEKSEIVGVCEKETGTDWNEVIKTADLVISQSSKDLPPEKINKTVFGLPDYWVENGKIKHEILGNLKKLCTELTLTPLGFVVISEAIIAQMQKNEGIPLNAILLGFTREEAVIDIVKIGKTIYTKNFTDKNNLNEKIALSLKEIPEEQIIPSRVILYGGNDLEKAKQDIMSYPWTQKASFLHFPKIEILDSESDINGIISVGIKEIKNSAEEIFSNTSSAPAGFYEEQDIQEKYNPPPQENPPELVVEEINEPNNLPIEQQEEKKSDYSQKKFDFSPISNFLKNILSLVSGKLVLLLIFFLILLSVAGYIGIFYYFSKADIEIFINPQYLEQEADITIDPHVKTIDKEKNILPSQNLEISLTSSLKKTTTGEKKVGEKAKGETILYNKTTTGAKSFKEGTILIGPNDIQFTLDEDITIPAAAEAESGTTYGKVKAKITAMEIGAEGNLTGKNNFTIKEYPTSSYNAISEEAITGGTSKTVKVVSENDVTKLTADLNSKMLSEAKLALEKKISTDYKVLIESVKKISEKIKTSPEIGDEGTEVTLEKSASYQALSYNQKDMDELVKDLINKSVPAEFEYKSSQTVIKIKEIGEPTGGVVNIKVIFKVSLIPKINKDEVIKTISGKNENFVKEYLKSLPNVLGFEASVSPKLPGFLFVFPKNPQNIKINLVPKN